MVTNVEPRIRHYHAADQCGNGGLAIERIGTVNDHPRIDCLLTSLFWVQHSESTFDTRWRRRGAACRHDPATLEDSVQLRYLHKFLDSRIQVCDFEVAAFVSCCGPCSQERAQTRAVHVRNIAQIKHDPVGNRSDWIARFRHQIANLPLKHLQIFRGNLTLTVDDGFIRLLFQLQFQSTRAKRLGCHD